MKRAQKLADKEPVRLMRQDGKRPDGTTILRWSRGRPLAWDITYADAHVVNTAREVGAAANHTATNKNTKYSQLSNTHVFVLVAIETGTWYMAPSGGGTGTGDWKTDGQHLILQAMPGSPTSCSSSCPWHYRGGMRSHFKTRSPPASSLQSVVSFS